MKKQTKQQENKIRKQNEGDERIPVEIIQPWSTFVMKTKLPKVVFDKMLEITNKIVDNAENEKSWGHNLAGQIEHELVVEREILQKYGIMQFFLDMVRHYVINQLLQMMPYNQENILNDEWVTDLLSMWVVSQKEHEYNPMHIHTQCQISAVMYLKVPKFSESRKSHREDDGSIVFSNNCSLDDMLASPQIALKPQVGDLYIFPAKLAHHVYPFRSDDEDKERRSVSFNAVYSSKSIMNQRAEMEKKAQEEMKKRSFVQ